MPELPDVEGFGRTFRRHATGKRIKGVRGEDDIVRNADVTELGRALRGSRFEEPERRGKWLGCRTDGPALLFHFGMTGVFEWAPDGAGPPHRHDRLILELEDGELRYRNMRKLGGVWLAHDEEELERILGALGPDAARISRRDFRALMARRRGGIKAALMDQRMLAGLGNLLVDEILWQAHIHPRRPVAAMDDEALDHLHEVMRGVLQASVRAGRIPEKNSWLISQRGRPDAVCPRHRVPLARTTVAGRTTYHCPSCQESQDPSAG